jgi:uncharacterized protein YgiM (DUF1202 family)
MRLRSMVSTSVLALCLVSAAAARAQGSEDAARSRPGDYVTNRPASLYAKPSADAHIIRRLAPHTVVNVVEVLDQWYKVRSSSGKEDGFIRRSYADPYHGGRVSGGGRGGGGGGGGARRFRVGKFKLIDPAIVRDSPSMEGRQITTLRAGTEVRITDKDPSGHWYKIESESGNRPPGWIPTQVAKRIE